MITHFEESKSTAICGIEHSWLHFAKAKWVTCIECRKKLIKKLPDGPWDMYALITDRGFIGIGSKMYAKFHGDSGDKLCKVKVSLDDEGDYYGWQDLGDTEPHMIQTSELLLGVCFGNTEVMQHRIDNKDGRIVRLSIEEVR
jgi:hypothetical protein